MLLLFAIPIIDKEVTAQEIIDNEALSENNDDNSDINKFVAKPQVNVNIQGTELDDKLRGGDGDDQIDGGKGGDALQGNQGDDQIDGGKGEDKLKGGDDNDKIDGGDDDDQIDGGNGDDVMDGGKGEDKLKGGKGADRFVCDMADKIIDYNSLENDKIVGQCKYEDKGLIHEDEPELEHIPDTVTPKQTVENEDLFPNSVVIPSKEDDSFQKFVSKFIGMHFPGLFK